MMMLITHAIMLVIGLIVGIIIKPIPDDERYEDPLLDEEYP